MNRTLLLAWRYICSHKLKTFILITCISITVYLPLTIKWLVTHYEENLLARAATTPLIIGSKGSRYDLALHTLYFNAKVPQAISYKSIKSIPAKYATVIPVCIKHTANEFPIVGTTLDYFRFRKLKIVQGKSLIRLGDCVIGASVANKLNLSPGAYLMSDPENVFQLSGSYPLNMRVNGVLAKTNTPDDDAIFVDIKTSWLIEGLAHGHQDLAKKSDKNIILKKEKGNIVANAALKQYTEVTDANINSFHFHGDTSNFPITTIIALPRDKKSGTLLRGRFLSHKNLQIILPEKVVTEIMSMVFKVKSFFDANMILITFSTGLFLVLVIILSMRLRHREIKVMFMLGCNRWSMCRSVIAELAIILIVSLLIATLLGQVTLTFGEEIIRRLIG